MPLSYQVDRAVPCSMVKLGGEAAHSLASVRATLAFDGAADPPKEIRVIRVIRG